jgi:hypothetical protein
MLLMTWDKIMIGTCLLLRAGISTFALSWWSTLARCKTSVLYFWLVEEHVTSG